MLTNHAKKSKHQLMVEVFMAQMRSDAQAIPTKPTVPSFEIRKLRAALMLEECLETIRLGLGIEVLGHPSTHEIVLDVTDAEFSFNEGKKSPNITELADGLADCHVVNEGTGSACGIALDPIYQIVMQNNLSKFAPGHTFRADGKLIKPPDFVGPENEINSELARQSNS